MSPWSLNLATLLLLVIPGILSRSVDISRLNKSNLFVGGAKRSSNVKHGDRPAPYTKIRQRLAHQIHTYASESKVLECEAGGNPPPTIHWLKNGRRVSQDLYEVGMPELDDGNRDVIPFIGLSFTKSRLYLDCLEPRDNGVYSCVAENPYFKDSSSTKLTVVSPQTDAEALCISKKSLGVPARIHMWTRTRLEQEGNDVQLFCRSAGFPEPEVSWLGPYDTVLQPSDKYEYLSNGDLVIRNIGWKDMGGYTCVANNVHGSDRQETFLYPTKKESKM